MNASERADRAQRILSDEVFKQAFSDVRAGLIERLESSPISDVETQHEIALMLQLLKQVKVKLEQYCNDQRMVEAQTREETFISRARQKLGI